MADNSNNHTASADERQPLLSNPPTTPKQHTHYRLGGLSSFIPLNEEQAALTTRGQRLPSIFQSRSSTSLFTVGRRAAERDRDRETDIRLPPNRRRSSFHSVSSLEDDATDTHADDALTDPNSGALGSPLHRRTTHDTDRSSRERDPRRLSLLGPEILNTPQMRSMRLIGNSNPRYRWVQYFKSEDELKAMPNKAVRRYYERCNYLISHYIYIDRLLDSSLPHDLIMEYQTQADRRGKTLDTISEVPEPPSAGPAGPAVNGFAPAGTGSSAGAAGAVDGPRVKRTPKNLYKLPGNGEVRSPAVDMDEDDEEERLLNGDDKDLDLDLELLLEDEGVESNDPVVTVAVYLNLVANALLLAAKIAVIVLTSSLSVLASLVDAALDFLSTAIVWTTTKLISHQDQYAYPIGRRRLEPVGVLVFSIVMITSFAQVGLECLNRLFSGDHTIVQLSLPSILIMLSTVLIKGFLWFWCRLVKNSSVQALAQDAMTDVVFNTFSIIFPLVGYYARIWWLDALGGLLLSLYVIVNWGRTSSEHVRNLCGAAATADQRNVLLYLTMRFAKTIRFIQGLQAYHAGDKLNVEVDIVLDENTVSFPPPLFFSPPPFFSLFFLVSVSLLCVVLCVVSTLRKKH
jgi:divalent metal cation (Fe/Co/Zn/Cd) transporter